MKIRQVLVYFFLLNFYPTLNCYFRTLFCITKICENSECWVQQLVTGIKFYGGRMCNRVNKEFFQSDYVIAELNHYSSVLLHNKILISFMNNRCTMNENLQKKNQIQLEKLSVQFVLFNNKFETNDDLLVRTQIATG